MKISEKMDKTIKITFKLNDEVFIDYLYYKYGFSKGSKRTLIFTNLLILLLSILSIIFFVKDLAMIIFIVVASIFLILFISPYLWKKTLDIKIKNNLKYYKDIKYDSVRISLEEEAFFINDEKRFYDKIELFTNFRNIFIIKDNKSDVIIPINAIENLEEFKSFVNKKARKV